MRPACVVIAALLCTTLARGQSQNSTAETQVQILYKAFAQNLDAFNVFLDLLPVRSATRCQPYSLVLSFLCERCIVIVMLQAPTEATVKKLYSTWLSKNKGMKFQPAWRSKWCEKIRNHTELPKHGCES